MRSTTVGVGVAAVALWVGLGSGAAAAQVCGDADASGAVGVTDGVQALRAAAGLGSSCTASRCDVDGSGVVTISDGVNVLRKAAGLTIAEACPAATTQESVRAFLGEMTKVARAPGVAASATLARVGAAAVPAVVVECDEGFFETDGDRAVYHACRFGTLLVDGAVTSTVDPRSDPENGRFIKTDVYERYEVRFLDSGFTFRQDGTSTIDIDTRANRLVENATLTIVVGDSALGQDEYTLRKIDLTTDTQSGAVLTGSLVSALASAGLAGIEEVTLGYRTSTTADVEVAFEDGHTESFAYDLVTNELTPLANGGAAARAAIDRRRA
ncbi:MAG: hypothetical protein IT294_08890 [Deltaproteobacteria bacterium]|nr:hypothetical protein [Deltaproteobacteria bacterium]